MNARLSNKGDYGLGRGDPNICQWQMNLVPKNELLQRVSAIKEALERTSAATYGVWKRCGEPPDRAIGGVSSSLACAWIVLGAGLERSSLASEHK